MADIIDFISNYKKQNNGQEPDTPPNYVDHITGFIQSLKDSFSSSRLMTSTQKAVGRKIMASLFVLDAAKTVLKTIEAIGLNPDSFSIDSDSFDRMLSITSPQKAELWGPWFYGRGEDDYTYLVTTHIILTEQLSFIRVIIGLYRATKDETQWEAYNNGVWDPNGPDDDYFAEILSRTGEDYDGDGEEDENSDDDYADEDSTLAMMNISVEAYNALDAAGIETMEDLTYLREKQLRAIPGMNDTLVDEVINALEDEGLELRI